MSGLSLPLSGPLCSYIQSLQQPVYGRNIIGPIPIGLTDLGWFNVLEYGNHVASHLTANITIPNVGSSVTVPVGTSNFNTGQLVSIWDTQHCFSGTVTAGGGTLSLTVQCTTIFAGAAGNTVDSSRNSQAEGISTDDSAMFAAAQAAAVAAGGGLVYIPPGSYATSATIPLQTNVSIIADGSSSIHPAGAVTNCFSFASASAGGSQFGNGSYVLPSILFFSLGAGILITDNQAAYYQAYVNTIYGCAQGILVHASTSSATATYVFRIQFNLILACTVGIKFYSTGSSLDQVQSMHFVGEAIIACNQAILFDQAISGIVTTTAGAFTIPAVGSTVTVGATAGFPNGSYIVAYNATSGYWMYGQFTSATVVTALAGTVGSGNSMPIGSTVLPWFELFGNQVFDISVINGNTAGYGGIAFSRGVWSQNTFRVSSSFGSFGNDAYVYTQNGGFGFGNYYELAADIGSGSFAPNYDGFNGLATPVLNVHPQNVLRIVQGGNSSIGNTQLAATTSANTRSSFNGGNPYYSQRFMVSLAFPGSATGGSVQDFYVYSPFASGSQAQHTFTPVFDTSPTVFLATVLDQHCTHPNEIRIRLGVPNTIGSGVTVFGMISIGQ